METFHTLLICTTLIFCIWFNDWLKRMAVVAKPEKRTPEMTSLVKDFYKIDEDKLKKLADMDHRESSYFQASRKMYYDLKNRAVMGITKKQQGWLEKLQIDVQVQSPSELIK